MGMSKVAHKIATIGPDDVTEEEIDALDSELDHMAVAWEGERREGDLIEFMTSIVESLKQGSHVALYATERES